MTRPPRRSHLLVPVCLLVGAGWLAGCRPATEKPVPDASRATPREIVLQVDGIPVTSLTYDSRVFFNTDQDRPRPEAGVLLDALAARLKRGQPPPQVAVLGHTDAIGTDAFNLDLSRRRARTVVQALVRRGVDPDRLHAVAVGKRQPVASNATEAGRARNRRVEFLLSPSAYAIGAVLRARPQQPSLRERHPAAQHLQQREPDALSRAPLTEPVPY